MHLSNLNLSAQLQGGAKFVVRFFFPFLLFFKTVQGLENLRPGCCRVICQFQLKFHCINEIKFPSLFGIQQTILVEIFQRSVCFSVSLGTVHGQV